jgi:hypothetical protein
MAMIPASSFGSNLARQMGSRPSDRFYRLFWYSGGRRGGPTIPTNRVWVILWVLACGPMPFRALRCR